MAKQGSKTLIRLMSALLMVAAVVLAGFKLWPQQTRISSNYHGPIEHISTGLIGEYAALVLVADEQGYFTEQGLDVTITEYPSGPASLDALLTGQIDTALASSFAGVRNSFTRPDLKVLATMSKSEAFYMIARKSRGISQVSDLKGKRIGLTQKTVGEFFLGQFLTFNYIGPSDVTIRDMPQAELQAALTKGEIDAAVLFEPNAYQSFSNLGKDAIRWSVQGGQPIYTNLYSTDQVTTQRPHVLRRYLKAVAKAEQYIRHHDTGARAIVASRLGYSQEYINYIWPQFVFEASLDQDLILIMEEEARWTIRNGLTSATKVPNYLHTIYTDSLEAAKPTAITIIR